MDKLPKYGMPFAHKYSILHVSIPPFLLQGNAVNCYDSQAELHASFNQLFASSQGNTLVPTMLAICKSSHRLAVLADREAASRDNARLNNAASLLQESYSKTFNDRKEYRPDAPFDEEGSKKAGVLAIVNQLFAIYFRLNTLRLCKNLAKPVEIKKLHLQGTMGQMVTYRYFSGRLCLYEDNFADAELNLEWALSNCHRNAFNNKRFILRYLIPVKLYCGKLPTISCELPNSTFSHRRDPAHFVVPALKCCENISWMNSF
jgi:nuclear mRNA export protein PCID2/THP1